MSSLGRYGKPEEGGQNLCTEERANAKFAALTTLTVVGVCCLVFSPASRSLRGGTVTIFASSEPHQSNVFVQQERPYVEHRQPESSCWNSITTYNLPPKLTAKSRSWVSRKYQHYRYSIQRIPNPTTRSARLYPRHRLYPRQPWRHLCVSFKCLHRGTNSKIHSHTT